MKPVLSPPPGALRYSHCTLPPWHLASLDFQDDPQPLALGDVRLTEARLWRALAGLPDPGTRARYFHDYVSVKFSLHAWADPAHSAPARAALRHSYVHCLRHWGVDSNGPSGAALKAWVESRFGLRPTYHAGCLATDVAARETYARDRIAGAARTAGLAQQLDLLYEFCQSELARRHPGARWLTLYRGTHDAEEYHVRPPASACDPAFALADWSQSACPAGDVVVEFNNLSSFTSDPEVAWEFGSAVWSARVPIAKILCFSGLLPSEFLQGEAEYLVLGGTARVTSLRA